MPGIMETPVVDFPEKRPNQLVQINQALGIMHRKGIGKRSQACGAMRIHAKVRDLLRFNLLLDVCPLGTSDGGVVTRKSEPSASDNLEREMSWNLR